MGGGSQGKRENLKRLLRMMCKSLNEGSNLWTHAQLSVIPFAKNRNSRTAHSSLFGVFSQKQGGLTALCSSFNISHDYIYPCVIVLFGGLRCYFPGPQFLSVFLHEVEVFGALAIEESPCKLSLL